MAANYASWADATASTYRITATDSAAVTITLASPAEFSVGDEITISSTNVQDALNEVDERFSRYTETVYNYIDPEAQRTVMITGSERNLFLNACKRIRHRLKDATRHVKDKRGPKEDPTNLIIPHGHCKGRRLEHVSNTSLRKIMETTHHPISYSALEMIKYKQAETPFKRAYQDFRYIYGTKFMQVRVHSPYKNKLQDIEKRFRLLIKDYENNNWVMTRSMINIKNIIERGTEQAFEQEIIDDFFF